LSKLWKHPNEARVNSLQKNDFVTGSIEETPRRRCPETKRNERSGTAEAKDRAIAIQLVTRDIQDAIAAIHRHLKQAGETTVAKEDPLLHDALLFQFVVIGEAVKHLSTETRESAPEIPWPVLPGFAT
jgi:hypothetical protein